MKLIPVTKIDQIKEGATLIINDGSGLINAKAKIVKITEKDGTEVIINVRKNNFFNVGMYLDGKSWVKDLSIVSA